MKKVIKLDKTPFEGDKNEGVAKRSFMTQLRRKKERKVVKYFLIFIFLCHIFCAIKNSIQFNQN
jgi:hypothetical protein